ncbi:MULTISPECIES: hypothetical protein [unclassified Methylobacterium]|uniref:hypothetical protein n=1 Tax=unclassified Methylobacterium TaxID=2615210 RepID=UPI00226AA76E|nr:MULTISPECIES: hypothetical protein [unclassified Methylobacterium]
MPSDRIEFSDPVCFRAEPGLTRAVATAARQARTTSSEWMRRTLREKLAAEGVALPPLDAPATRQAA